MNGTDGTGRPHRVESNIISDKKHIGNVRLRSNTLANRLGGSLVHGIRRSDPGRAPNGGAGAVRPYQGKVAVARIVLHPGVNKKPRSATIGAWERETMGLTLPSLRRLADLYEEFGGISPSWVVLGDGPIKKPDLEETP